MIGYIIKKIIGSKNEREVKRLRPLVAQINALALLLNYIGGSQELLEGYLSPKGTTLRHHGWLLQSGGRLHEPAIKGRVTPIVVQLTIQ